MTSLLKKQHNLNNAFLIKKRKIISIMIVIFLLIPIMDSVSSTGVFLLNNSKLH